MEIFIDLFKDKDRQEMLSSNALEQMCDTKKAIEELRWRVWNLKDISQRYKQWLDTLESPSIDDKLEAAVHEGQYQDILQSIFLLTGQVDLDRSLDDFDKDGYYAWANDFHDRLIKANDQVSTK